MAAPKVVAPKMAAPEKVAPEMAAPDQLVSVRERRGRISRSKVRPSPSLRDPVSSLFLVLLLLLKAVIDGGRRMRMTDR